MAPMAWGSTACGNVTPKPLDAHLNSLRVVTVCLVTSLLAMPFYADRQERQIRDASLAVTQLRVALKRQHALQRAILEAWELEWEVYRMQSRAVELQEQL